MLVRKSIQFLLIALGVIGVVPSATAEGDVTKKCVLEEAATGENWFLKGGNFRGEHFSPLSQVKDENVADLELAWSTDLPIPDGISATPIVVDGVIYLSGAFSIVYAVDAADGHVIWSFDPRVRQALAEDPFMGWSARVNRGVAVWHGMVIGGARLANGMPAFSELDTEQSEAIRNYVLSMSEELRAAQDSR